MTNQLQDNLNWRSLLEEMTESVLVTTTDLDSPGPSVVYVNPAFERMTGWSREDIVGKSPRVLQGPKTDHQVFRDLRERLSHGEAWRGQTINYRKDGSEFFMEWSIVPIQNERGGASLYLAVQRDVTERVELENNLAATRKKEQEWFAQLQETNWKLNELNAEQQKTLRLFVKYVPESVVKKGLDSHDESLFQGEQLRIAVMFCDMRGFTALSENLAPHAVVTLLNTFYTMMARVIVDHQGVINQFVGDEIFVAFGAPMPIRDCVGSAVRCAVAMIRQMDAINSKLRELIDQEICVGIGLNYGWVVAGNLGSEHRIAYSITGDTVNTAKRIESLAKAGTNTILMSEAVYEQVQDRVMANPWPSMAVKGKGAELKVHELLGVADEMTPE